MKRVMHKTIMLFVLLLGTQYAAQAQSTQNVELEGYCTVAYHVMNKAVKGNPDYSSTYEGKTYYFVKGDAKKMFDAKPTAYLPKYDGYCATAMSMGKKIESDPQLFSEYKNETYLFSTQMAKEKFDKNPEMFIGKADKEFAKLKK